VTINNLSPLSNLKAELRPLFSNGYMLAFFKKFCDAIKSRMWGCKTGKNARYDAEAFLKVFFYSEITGRSIESASERLNKYFLIKKRGRRKKYADGRNKREVPHQTGVNKFLRGIGLKKAKRILRECLDNQLKEALKLGLISRRVNVLIDFTEHDYYGKRKDKMIKRTNQGKGTKNMRQYLGFSILSRGIHLYAGLEHFAKKQSQVPTILKFLQHLINLEFKIKFVLMDREFFNAELISKIKAMKADILIPAKSFRKIKQIIEDYIRGTGNRVRTYTVSTGHKKKIRFSQKLYLILQAKKGYSLLEVKRGFQRGILTLNDAMKLIYPITTSQKPKSKPSSWPSRTSNFYKKRWFIETGFSDLNRMGRRWKSRYDNTRYLDLLVRMLLYNSWKINRKYLEKIQTKRQKSQKWTLQDNQDVLIESFLEA